MTTNNKGKISGDDKGFVYPYYEALITQALAREITIIGVACLIYTS